MQRKSVLWSSLLALLLLSFAYLAHSNPKADGMVVLRENKNEDVYLAGGAVYALSKIDGDVVAAGGYINVENEVTGDVLAAGGNVSIRAKVGDDVRVAGGNISLSGPIGDDALAAGGSVMVAPTATIRGRGWFAGGHVVVHGKIGKGLRAAGRNVVIGGEITGDAEVTADTIEVLPGAVITGNLRYRSPHEARIDGSAKIAGTVTREEFPRGGPGQVPAGVTSMIFFGVLLLTALQLYTIFPRSSIEIARTIEAAPWKSLGLGVAVLLAAPPAILILLVTIFAAGLGFIAFAIFPVLLLLGLLAGALYLGDVGLRLVRKEARPARTWRVLSIVAAFVALWIVCWIPVLGILVTLVVMVFGVGALVLNAARKYSAAQ